MELEPKIILAGIVIGALMAYWMASKAQVKA